MKKCKTWIIAFLVTLCCSLFFFACNTGNSSTPSGSGKLYLSPEEISLEIGDEYTLSLYNPNALNVEWTSENTAIATVDGNGKVTAVSEGIVVIKASSGKEQVSCIVKIGSLLAQPILVTNETELAILLDDTFTLTARLVTGDANKETQLNYAVADGEVITVVKNQGTENGVYSFDVTGKKVGTTQLTLSTTYEGIAVSKIIAVTVKEDVAFTFAENAILDTDTPVPSLDLYMSAPVANEYVQPMKNYTGLDGTTLVVDSVRISASAVNAPAITWKSDDETVVTATNGVLQPVSTGSTYVYACYNGYEQAVLVNVLLPEVQLKNTRVDLETLNDVTFPVPSYITDVVDLRLDGESVFNAYDADKSEIVYNAANLEIGDGKKVEILCEDIAYVAEASVVTKILKTKADLDAFRTLAKEFYPRADRSYGGYFILGANIDYNDLWPEFLSSSHLNDPNIIIDSAKGFLGTFDGRGYTINGLKTQASSFIGWLGIGGVIKNVGFLNADNGAGIVAKINGGTVDNVFVSGVNSSGNLNNCFISDIVGEGATITNCVVYVESNAGGNNFGPIYSRLKTNNIANANITLANNFVVGCANYRATAGTTTQHIPYPDANANKTYATYADFIANYDKNAFSGLNTNIWTISDEAELPILKRTENNIYGNDRVFSGISFALDSLLDSEFALVSPVNGVTIDGEMLNVASSVPYDTEFTVKAVAKINKALMGEKTFRVVTPMSGTVTSLNKSVDIDLSSGTDIEISLDGTAFETGELFSVEMQVVKNGVPTSKAGDMMLLNVESLDGKTLRFTNKDVRSIPAGIYTMRVGVEVGGSLKIFALETHLITKIAKTTEDFIGLSLSANGDLGKYGASERAQGYFVLGANISGLENSTFYTINGGMNFTGIFDGRGYNIDGFKTSDVAGRSGLFANVYGGIVRNVSFTNAVKGKGTGGLIALRIGGYAADISQMGKNNNTPVNWYGEFTNIFISGKFVETLASNMYVSMFAEYTASLGHATPLKGVKINNVIIELTETPTATSGWGVMFSIGNTNQFGTSYMQDFSNVYVLGINKIGRESTASTLLDYWVNDSGNGNVGHYASADLTQAVGNTTLGEKIAANGEIWSYANGKLTMKNQTESVDLINN